MVGGLGQFDCFVVGTSVAHILREGILGHELRVVQLVEDTFRFLMGGAIHHQHCHPTVVRLRHNAFPTFQKHLAFIETRNTYCDKGLFHYFTRTVSQDRCRP